MKRVILTGRKLTYKNVKKAIYERATVKTQGAHAVAEKHDGRIAKVFLFNDNGRNMFKEDGKILNFVCSEFSSVLVL